MTTYVHNPSCLTPIMTSNTTPAPVVISCSGYINDAYTANNAFNQNGGATFWGVAATTGWLGVYSGLINGYGWRATTYTVTAPSTFYPETRSPKDWALLGSNDGLAWTTLDTQSNQTGWIANMMRSYQVASPGIYLYYRISVSANNGDSGVLEIGELELIGTVQALPSFTQSGYEITSLPTLTSNSLPTPYIASASSELDSSHQAFLAFDKSEISGCWQSSGNPNASWLQLYVGTTALSVSRYEISAPIDPSLCSSMPQSWVFQGSADGITNWATMDTQTNQTGWNAGERRIFRALYAPSCLYFRITVSQNNGGANVCIAELNMTTTYVHNPSCLTPIMTSNTTPAPVVISCSGYINDAYTANNAFNQNGGATFWGVAATTGWLGVYSGLINGYGWRATTYTVTAPSTFYPETRSPKDWALLGSNDGLAWTTLDTQSNQTGWIANMMRSYQVASPGIYLYYRISVSANNGDSGVLEIGELELIGTAESKATLLSLFFLHG